MRKITFLSCFAILAYLIFSVNYSYSFFGPKELEKLEKQYYSIKASRTPLTEEEKEIIREYELYKKMKDENRKAYEENIKKYGPDWEKGSETGAQVAKRIIESEPKLKKIVDENPNMTFYEAFEKFKKENPELIEERSKANRNIESRSYCNRDNGVCPANKRQAAVDYALKWSSNIQNGENRKRNPDYVDFGVFDCTNFASQVLRAGYRQFVKNFSGGSKKDTRNWFYGSWSSSDSWRLVEKLRENFQKNKQLFKKVEKLSDLDVGDIAFLNRRGGDFDHTVIITEKGRGDWDTRVTYHGNDSKNLFWGDMEGRLEGEGILNSTEFEYWKVNYDDFF